MQVGVYSDGRQLSYDEASGQFTVGDAQVTPQQVAAYDASGQLAWATPESRTWFQQNFGPAAVAAPAPAQPAKKKRTGLIIGLVVGALLLFGLCGVVASLGKGGGSGTGSTASAPSDGSTSTTAASTSDKQAASDSGAESTDSSFKDGTLTTPEMKIVITKHKVIPPGQKGNEYGKKPVIAFWYKVTNVSGQKTDPTTAWAFNMQVFQDNDPNSENKLEAGSLPDEKFLDTQMENIKKGGTVENAVAYELDDTKTPVVLVAGGMLGSEEIGRMTFAVK